MKIVQVSKSLLNPISLPGMGKSIELPELSPAESNDIRAAFARNELFIEWTEEPGHPVQVISLWPNPHSAQLTLFVK